MGPRLRLLSAGAAQGLTKALAPAFERDMQCAVDARFMPVGALEEALVAGEPCDVVVSSEAMLQRFAREARVDAATIARLGAVYTGIAVKVSEPLPTIESEERLRAALLAAPRLYVPDPQRATAGIHCVKVLRALGIYDRLASRLASHANGVAAMTALAASKERGALGCTQLTEILYTAGVTLVGALPQPFALGTVYATAVSASAVEADLGRRFVAMLSTAAHAEARRQAGFEA
ncbi:MAG TPA: substrate-binding domain-containing protein [Casimicrobiaceae bacterium]|nr:substrate-binding domain-containing protein [Casimicrobiaceae bacterium]